MGKEKKSLKPYEAKQAGGGGGRINSPLQKDKKETRAENRKARSEEVGGHTAQDKKQI